MIVYVYIFATIMYLEEVAQDRSLIKEVSSEIIFDTLTTTGGLTFSNK